MTTPAVVRSIPSKWLTWRGLGQQMGSRDLSQVRL